MEFGPGVSRANRQLMAPATAWRADAQGLIALSSLSSSRL